MNFDTWVINEYGTTITDPKILALMESAFLAAGASEGHAEPVAEIVDVGDGLGTTFIEFIVDRNQFPVGTKFYAHPSAEISALRERIAGMEKDARNSSFDAQIGHALIANGLYDRMNDMVDADEPRRLIEELIATVNPILDAKWAARDAAIAKEPK